MAARDPGGRRPPGRPARSPAADGLSPGDFRQIVERTTDAVIAVDTGSGRIVYANPAATRLLGHDAEAFRGLSVEDLLPPAARPAHAGQVARFVASGTTSDAMGERRMIRALARSGAEIPFFVSLVRLDGAAGAPVVAVVLRDARAEMEARDELAALSVTDPLTGLPNRRAFDTRLALEVERVRRYGAAMSLAMLDIDHFKRVNDSRGHPFGDVVLRGIGAELARRTRKTDLAARIGGEEFAIVFPGTPGAAAAAACETLRGAVGTLRFGETPVLTVTVSIGVASVGDGAATTLDPAALFAAADAALYAAKAAGRDRVIRA
jgi:diguanylate cyclase (GGDEF)-like protein/PAS domain S-box-containing protein